MECNKEEAEKCKAISEASLKKLDLPVARRFALKAKQLFPELEGLAQFTSILDVSIAAHEKLQNGEANWYAILQVDFRADENTIRKQYRKLALFLHPDKNKSFGAEAAFKYISQAWSVLSDGKKKSDYDKRWCAHMALQRARAGRTPHKSAAFQARENIRKHHMHGSQQAQQDALQNQSQRRAHPGLSQVHDRQGQGQGQGQAPFHAHKQQGQAKLGTELPEQQGHVHADRQQGQAHQQRGNMQGQTDLQQGHDQVHEHADQQKRQGRRLTHCLQRQQSQSQKHMQGQTPLNHKQQQGEGHPQQEGQGEGHAGQREQGEVHVQQQEQGQTHNGHADQQKRQGRRVTHYLQRQQSQSQKHMQGQTPLNQKQQQGEAHPQQKGQGEGHAGQREQGEVHVQQQEQGQTHNDLQQQKGQDVHQQQGEGQVHVERQCQSQEQVLQQGQGKGRGHQQQGQGRAYEKKRNLQPDSQHNEAFISKLVFAHDKSTFWTACPSCKMQFEYERVYMNKNLCCPMCLSPFVSKEIEPRKGVILWPQPLQQDKKEASELDAGNRSCTVSEPDSICLAAENTPQMVHSNTTVSKVKEDNFSDHKCEKPPGAKVCGDETTRSKEIGEIDGLPPNINRSAATDQAPASRRVQNVAAPREKKAYVGNMMDKENDLEACNLRVRTRNSVKSKEFEVRCSSATMSIPAADQTPASTLSVQNLPAASNKKATLVGMKRKASCTDVTCLSVRTRHSAAAKEICGSGKGSHLRELGSSKMENSRKSTITGLEGSCTVKRAKRIANQVEVISNSVKESESHQLLPKDREIIGSSSLRVDFADGLGNECEMEVPDSDFYNFDEDRTEKHFAVGQFWATYDDDDGMPRYYARITKILAIQPLKMQMNWLEAHNCTGETVAWLDAGFQQSCGDFKLGNVYIADQVSTFSHLMTVEKTSKGDYKVYPRHGDVWAIYKDWELLKASDEKCGYDLVEIIATFDGKRGVQVAPLFKLAGFKTLFERKVGEGCLKWIPLHEIRRFSHQVPVHPIVAGTVPGIQVDCLELDPASIPMNLIIGDQ